MQSLARAAALLGRTKAEGRYLARRYWNGWYQWHDPVYRSRDCRNNGRLDLWPTNVWP
jgi:hypothetical protein